MNETERLILENHKLLLICHGLNIPKDSTVRKLIDIQGEKIDKALAPQSSEHGYEKDLAEKTEKQKKRIANKILKDGGLN